MKKASKEPTAIAATKEDCQAFGKVLSTSVSWEVALAFPLTKYPFSIATPDGFLRQGAKATLRNFLIDLALDAVEVQPPPFPRWLVDGMSVFRALKSKATYREWFSFALDIIKRDVPASAKCIEIVNDTYIDNSIKSATRSARNQQIKTFHLSSLDQKMPEGKSFDDLFSCNSNKNALMELFLNHCRSLPCRETLTLPLTVTCHERCYEISPESIETLPFCNQEDADTKIMHHVSQSDTDIVVVSKDTDVFVLLVHFFAVLKPDCNWFMNIGNDQYINIKRIVDLVGIDLAVVLPQFHAITGSDTTSFKFNIGKVKVLKKLMKNPEYCHLIKNLGRNEQLAETDVNKAITFVQTVMYGGKQTETYIETRKRLYERSKSKSSSKIPPDPKSLLQDIKRVHLQSYVFLHATERVCNRLDPEYFGWTKDQENGTLIPHWYDGKQYPEDDVMDPPPPKRMNISVQSEGNDGEIHMDGAHFTGERLTDSQAQLSQQNRYIAVDNDEEIDITDDYVYDSEWEPDFPSSEEDFDSSDEEYLP